MLSFFRSTQAYVGLPFLFYALLLQLPVFFGAPDPVAAAPETFGVAGAAVARWAAAHGWLARAVPVFLFALLAAQAGVMSNRHQFTRAATQLAPLGVLLTGALVPGFRTLHPGMLANVFLGFAVISLLRIYKNQYPQFAIFNIGAWIAVASFFVPAYLLFLLPVYVATGIMGRRGFWKMLRLFTGVAVLYFLAGTLAYFFGVYPEFVLAQRPAFSLLLVEATPFQLAFAGLLTLLCLFLVVRYSAITRSINIEGSKGVNSTYWLLLFVPVVLLFGGGIAVANLYALVLPAGLLLGLSLHNTDERKAELLHLLLLVGGLIGGSLHLLP